MEINSQRLVDLLRMNSVVITLLSMNADQIWRETFEIIFSLLKMVPPSDETFTNLRLFIIVRNLL